MAYHNAIEFHLLIIARMFLPDSKLKIIVIRRSPLLPATMHQFCLQTKPLNLCVSLCLCECSCESSSFHLAIVHLPDIPSYVHHSSQLALIPAKIQKTNKQRGMRECAYNKSNGKIKKT